MKKLVSIATFLALAAALAFILPRTSLVHPVTWQRQASPGQLSAAHAFLEDNCASCHTPVKGIEAANCAACHANNDALLGRQPTAFHAHIKNCSECHLEHQGVNRRPSWMDHEALARISLDELDEGDPESEQQQARSQLLGWIRQHGPGEQLSPGRPDITPEEAILDCAGCHSTRDRHLGLFGKDCAQCHGTAKWTIAEFRHPSPRSTECAQCHQAPPSHYMGHFAMVSKSVARQPDAQVNQCYLCHQTTAWNDIKGVGWYKHH